MTWPVPEWSVFPRLSGDCRHCALVSRRDPAWVGWPAPFLACLRTPGATGHRFGTPRTGAHDGISFAISPASLMQSLARSVGHCMSDCRKNIITAAGDIVTKRHRRLPHSDDAPLWPMMASGNELPSHQWQSCNDCAKAFRRDESLRCHDPEPVPFFAPTRPGG